MNKSEFENMTEPTELHPDLAPFLELDNDPFPVLRHPLVYAVPYMEPLNKSLNLSYASKKASLNEALEEERFYDFVFLHERPYRPAAMDFLAGLMSDSEVYSGLLLDVWSDTEFPHLNDTTELFLELFDHPLFNRSLSIDAEDYIKFNSLLDSIGGTPIYRGVSGVNSAGRGMSWTLDRDKAVWFAKRFDYPNPRVATAMLPDESTIFSFTDRRSESEVIVDYRRFEPVDIETV